MPQVKMELNGHQMEVTSKASSLTTTTEKGCILARVCNTPLCLLDSRFVLHHGLSGNERGMYMHEP